MKQPKIGDVKAAYIDAVNRLELLFFQRQHADPKAKGKESYRIKAGDGLTLVVTLGANGKIAGRWVVSVPECENVIYCRVEHHYETVGSFECGGADVRGMVLPKPYPLGSQALQAMPANAGRCVSVREARALGRRLVDERTEKIKRDLEAERSEYWDRSVRAFEVNTAQEWTKFRLDFGSQCLNWGGDAPELLGEFEKEEIKRYSAKSKAGFRYAVKKLRELLNGVNIQDFRALDTALVHFGGLDGDRRRYYSVFGRFLDWCVGQGRLMMNPFKAAAFVPYKHVKTCLSLDDEAQRGRHVGRVVPESLHDDFFEPLTLCIDAMIDASLIRLLVLCVLTVSPLDELAGLTCEAVTLDGNDPHLIVPKTERRKHKTRRRVLLSAAAVTVLRTAVDLAAKAGGRLLFPNRRGNAYTAPMLSNRAAKALQGRCTFKGAAVGAFKHWAALQGAADAVISIVCGNKVKTELRSELEPQVRDLLEEWGKVVTASVPDDWRSVCGLS